MTTTINQLIETIHDKWRILNHQQDSSTGLNQYYCSCFVKDHNLLVKGEVHNPKKSERNALIVFIDAETNKVKGEEMSLE